jgi:hypothetical protein
MRSLGPCPFCGRPAVHLHHITGRCRADGPYLDPGLVIGLCKRCHNAEHAALRRAGLEWPSGDELQHRLLRLAHLLVRIHQLGRPIELGSRSAEALVGLLRELVDVRSKGQEGAA